MICSPVNGAEDIYVIMRLTFGEVTLTYTMMGASEVLASCAGWLMVSASRTTSWRVLANSNILSISLCTSAGCTNTQTAPTKHEAREKNARFLFFNIFSYLFSQFCQDLVNQLNNVNLVTYSIDFATTVFSASNKNNC